MIIVTERPYQYNWSGNAIHYKLSSDEAVSDPSIFFEVKTMFSADLAADPVEVVTLPYIPTAGEANINIQDILDSVLSYGVPSFNDDETVPFECTKQSGRFYIEFRQITAANADPSWNNEESGFMRFVFKGGISFFKYQSSNFWINYFNQTGSFLTWQSRGRLAAYNERMYLCFLTFATVAAGNMKISVRIVNADSNESTSFFNINAQPGRPWLIPAGALQYALPIPAVPNKIFFWEIQVLDMTVEGSPVALSEIFRFYQDNRNDYNQIQLHYRNSLGGLDSVRVRGPYQQNLDYTTIQKDAVVPADYYAADVIGAPSAIVDNQEIVSYKGDIGHLTKQEQQRLRDAFVRREVYQAINKKWIPILIVQKSFTLNTSTDQRWSLPIEWKPAISGDRYFTPDDIVLGNDPFVANTCPILFSSLACTMTFPGDHSIALVNFTFLYGSTPSQDPVNLQYMIVGFTDWTTFDNANDITLSIASNQQVVVQFRARCDNGEYGSPGSISVDTTYTADPPPATNSILSNDSSSSSTAVVKINGGNLFTSPIGPRSKTNFNVTNINDVTVSVQFNNGFRPTSGILQTTGSPILFATITNVADGAIITFSHVTIVDGMTISFS